MFTASSRAPGLCYSKRKTIDNDMSREDANRSKTEKI